VRLNLYKITEALKHIKEYLIPVKKISGKFKSLTTLDELKKFIQEQSAHVTQTTLYGYIKTRMGFKHYIMFEDKEFLKSLEIAKWNIFVEALADCTLYTFSYLISQKNLKENKAEEFYIKILEEESFNGLPRKLIDESKNNFILRLKDINWKNYFSDKPFTNSGKALFYWSPISDELKELDKEIVLNSMKYKWDLVQNEFKNLTKDFKSS